MTVSDVSEAAACVRVELPPQLVAIAVGRAIVRRLVEFGSNDLQSSYLVAFTEVVANAIDEHQRRGITDAITVSARYGERPAIEVADCGGGVPPTRAEPEAFAERGRGLALARAFVERLDLTVDERGTTATLPLDEFGALR